MPTMPLNQIAFLFEWLALRMPKRNSPAVIFVRENGIPFRPGIRPEAEFSNNEHSISTRCLAGPPLYCQLSPVATARLSRDAIVFCLATPKRSRHSTGE